MKENIQPNIELTAGRVSSTLNARSTMDNGQNEQPRQSKKNEAPHAAKTNHDAIRPETIGEMLSDQAARETGMAIFKAAKSSGQILTTDQIRLIRSLGLDITMAGGADVPENDEFNPGDTDNPASEPVREATPISSENWSVQRREEFTRNYEGSLYSDVAHQFADLMRDSHKNEKKIKALLKEFGRQMDEGQRQGGSDFDRDGKGIDLRLRIGEYLSAISDDSDDENEGRERYFSKGELDLIAEPGEAGRRYREKRFNTLFENATANPSQPFNESFDIFTDKPVYRRFLEIIRASAEEYKNSGNKVAADELLRESRKFTEEFNVRSTLHDANYILTTNVGPDKISEFASRLTSGQVDLAFRKKGATTAMHFYEQALIKVREENFGYLPYKDVVGDTTTGEKGRVELLARRYMKDALAAGAVFEVTGTDPQTGLEKKAKVLPNSMEDWEMDRALAIARGMGVMTGRFIEIAMTSKLPRGRYTSLWAHGFLGSLSPFRHSIGKFDIAEEKNRFLAYKLENKSKKWKMEELEEVTGDLVFNVINGLVADEDQRLFGKVNPLHTGGIVSKTGWRVAGDPSPLKPGDKGKYKDIEHRDEIIEENPIFNESSNSAIGAMIKASTEARKRASERGEALLIKDDPYSWVGIGVLIDKARGGLHSDNPETRKKSLADLKIQLERTAKILPTRLIFNFKEARRYSFKEFKNRTGVITPEANMMLNSPEGETRFNLALDALIVAQEKAIGEHSENLNFDHLTNNSVRTDAELIARIVREGYVGNGSTTSHMDKLIDDYVNRDWKIPFISGSEDIPWDEYRFENVGGNIVMRRWNDIGQAAAAGKAMHELAEKLINVKSQDQILELLHPIHASIAQYDAHRANEVIYDLAIGIDRFFANDELANLPVVGGIRSLVTGKASFAQVVAGGRHGMAWDAREHWSFARKLRNHRMINDDQEESLRNTSGGTRKDLAKKYTMVIIQALLLAAMLKVLLSASKDALT